MINSNLLILVMIALILTIVFLLIAAAWLTVEVTKDFYGEYCIDERIKRNFERIKDDSKRTE